MSTVPPVIAIEPLTSSPSSPELMATHPPFTNSHVLEDEAILGRPSGIAAAPPEVALIPSSVEVMRISPELTVIVFPSTPSYDVLTWICPPLTVTAASAWIVIVASLTVIESRPLIPSLTAATVTVAPLSARSSLLWIPLLWFPFTVRDPVPVITRSSALNKAAFGSSAPATSYR